MVYKFRFYETWNSAPFFTKARPWSDWTNQEIQAERTARKSGGFELANIYPYSKIHTKYKANGKNIQEINSEH